MLSLIETGLQDRLKKDFIKNGAIMRKFENSELKWPNFKLVGDKSL